MKIALASDHAGFERKRRLADYLRRLGHEVNDLGCTSLEPCDYPDYALAAAEAVVQGRAERALLVCGTGIGTAIAANKVPGIRAANCWHPEAARLASQHNQANVLTVPGRFLSDEQVYAIVRAWLDHAFEGNRHERRLAKISGIEKKYGGAAK